MNQHDYVKAALESLHTISEVEIKYLNKNKTTYSLPHKSSREVVITQLLTQVDWDLVDEVEFKIAKGKKKHVDLVEYREQFSQNTEQNTAETTEIVEASEGGAAGVEAHPVIIPFNKSRSAAASRRAKVLEIPKRKSARASIQSRSKARTSPARKRKP